VFAPDFDELLEQLNEIAPQLTTTRLMLLNRMASALQMTFDSWSDPNSDLATALFSEYFTSRLLIHHAVVEEKLNKKSFEYIFRDALRHDGKTAHITASNIHPGADLVVNGTRISLKTEASKDIREMKITISKFMEARWIRDQDAFGLAELASEKIREHLAGYDRVIMLRAFSSVKNKVKYNLIEIPHDLLILASSLEPDGISLNSGRSGGGSTIVRQKDQEAFTLRFDGSVEKVTITNLRMDLCTIHATWNIPLSISNFETDR
jgi:Type II site-specific deoxyribonuclease